MFSMQCSTLQHWLHFCSCFPAPQPPYLQLPTTLTRSFSCRHQQFQQYAISLALPLCITTSTRPSTCDNAHSPFATSTTYTLPSCPYDAATHVAFASHLSNTASTISRLPTVAPQQRHLKSFVILLLNRNRWLRLNNIHPKPQSRQLQHRPPPFHRPPPSLGIHSAACGNNSLTQHFHPSTHPNIQLLTRNSPIPMLRNNPPKILLHQQPTSHLHNPRRAPLRQFTPNLFNLLHGTADFTARTLSHGKYCGLIPTRSIAESVFITRLL